MAKIFWLLCLLLLAGGLLFYFYRPVAKNPQSTTLKGSMQLASPAFADNTHLPVLYTCDGEGVNPPLVISDIPRGAKSLAIIVDDPDAPMGTYVHWVVYNISPATTEIAQHSVPAGSLQGKTSAGKQGFVAACPPSGTHRYFFKLYALDIMLPVAPVLDQAGLENAMKGHIVASAQLIGLYSRQ